MNKIADGFLNKYKFSNADKKDILGIVSILKRGVSDSQYLLKELLSNFGLYVLQNAIKIKALKSDIKEISDSLEFIIKNNHPYLISHLKIDGNDLIEYGIENRDIGKILKYLLKCVMKNPELNTKDKLLKLLGE